MPAIDTLNKGTRWTDYVAMAAMPVVLWCAMNGKKIQYGQLQEEIFRRNRRFFQQHGVSWQDVCTKYGRPAGKIGDIIFELAEDWDERIPAVNWNVDIPPVNAIIVSKKTGLPSHGVEWYLQQFTDVKVTKDNVVEISNQVIQSVFDYPEWRRVARELGYDELEPVEILEDVEDVQLIELPPQEANLGGCGESDEHKVLKKWVMENPGYFNQYGEFQEGDDEVLLGSGDRVDVVFENEELTLAVEVKTANAPDVELSRGIFQCIKYRATLRAMQLLAGQLPNAQAILATQRELTGNLLYAANRLKVAWILVP